MDATKTALLDLELSTADRSRFHGEYKFKLIGRTDLLVHHDSPVWSDAVSDFRKNDPAGKKAAAGDDRNPPWTYHGYFDLNDETGNVCIPQMNLSASLRDGGKKVSSSKRGSMKSASATAFSLGEPCYDITLPDGRLIPFAPIDAIRGEPFSVQHADIKALGISLDVRRASVGASKHVRVRPRIPAGWSIGGTLTVEDASLTHGALLDIFVAAGRLAGLGDWRPSSPKSPGPFGRFVVADLSPVK